MITAEERDKILAAKDPRELVDVLEVAMNEFLDFLQSAPNRDTLGLRDRRGGSVKSCIPEPTPRAGPTLAIGLG